MLLISAKNRVDKHKCLRSEKQLDLLMGLQHKYNAWNDFAEGQLQFNENRSGITNTKTACVYSSFV